jgi:hypothetical protein
VFARELASVSGLDRNVVIAWVLAEESGAAAEARQTAGNHDWLNIGYTGSGTFGASDPAWTDPQEAADRSWDWVLGKWAPQGFGFAAASIRTIATAPGKPPADQLRIIQDSGWAASGYPTLPAIYAQIVTQGGAVTPQPTPEPAATVDVSAPKATGGWSHLQRAVNGALPFAVNHGRVVLNDARKTIAASRGG